MGELPSTCRLLNGTLSRPQWTLAPGPRGACPPGTVWDLPRHPQENYGLAAALRSAGTPGAWLPVHGPEWSVDGWPARPVGPWQPAWWMNISPEGPIAGALGLAALVGVLVVVRRRRPMDEPVEEGPEELSDPLLAEDVAST